MTRYVLGIEYDGSAYSGWQRQTNSHSIQSSLEQALSKVANEPVLTQCAGRTDSGVHALEQVVHFDSNVQRTLDNWILGANANLPEQIRVIWIQEAVGDFHARFSAIARYYRYIIYNRPVRSALQSKQTTWVYPELNSELMQEAAQHLLGENDFSSFRAQDCQSVSPNRCMYFIDVHRQQNQVIIDLSANAFLHHMVRNIAGVLIDIGSGKRSTEWTKELLAIKDRSKASVTAPPHGLYLSGIYYPEHFKLPMHPIFKRLPEGTQRFQP